MVWKIGTESLVEAMFERFQDSQGCEDATLLIQESVTTEYDVFLLIWDWSCDQIATEKSIDRFLGILSKQFGIRAEVEIVVSGKRISYGN